MAAVQLVVPPGPAARPQAAISAIGSIRYGSGSFLVVESQAEPSSRRRRCGRATSCKPFGVTSWPLGRGSRPGGCGSRRSRPASLKLTPPSASRCGVPCVASSRQVHVRVALVVLHGQELLGAVDPEQDRLAPEARWRGWRRHGSVASLHRSRRSRRARSSPNRREQRDSRPGSQASHPTEAAAAAKRQDSATRAHGRRTSSARPSPRRARQAQTGQRQLCPRGAERRRAGSTPSARTQREADASYCHAICSTKTPSAAKTQKGCALQEGSQTLRQNSPHPLARPYLKQRLAYPCRIGTERADARIRTADPFITSEVLYQLSYVGVAPRLAGMAGSTAQKSPPNYAERADRCESRATLVPRAASAGSPLHW